MPRHSMRMEILMIQFSGSAGVDDVSDAMTRRRSSRALMVAMRRTADATRRLALLCAYGDQTRHHLARP
jgi:hypothetical protein